MASPKCNDKDSTMSSKKKLTMIIIQFDPTNELFAEKKNAIFSENFNAIV